VLAAVALVIVARAIGRRPVTELARRLAGSTPLRPLGSEPGAERWFAVGGVVVLVGLGIAALLSESVGYPVVAIGLLLVAWAGVLIALDHRGAARAFVRRTWTELGISVPAPLLQMRVIGGGMVLIGLAGALIAVAQAFR
jgi:hypothetical protein